MAAGVELAAYRTLQHALAVVGGAGDRPARIRVRYFPDRLELEVRGSRAAGGAASAALMAARERVLALGGSFSAETPSAGSRSCAHGCPRCRRMRDVTAVVRRVAAGPQADRLVFLGFVGMALVEELVRADADRSPRAIGWILALSCPLLLRRSRPVLATCLTAALIVALPDLAAFPPGVFAVVLPVVLSYSCGAYSETRRAWPPPWRCRPRSRCTSGSRTPRTSRS